MAPRTEILGLFLLAPQFFLSSYAHDGIFKTANVKFLNLNYIICYSHPRVTFSPCIQSPEKSLIPLDYSLAKSVTVKSVLRANSFDIK